MRDEIVCALATLADVGPQIEVRVVRIGLGAKTRSGRLPVWLGEGDAGCTVARRDQEGEHEQE